MSSHCCFSVHEIVMPCKTSTTCCKSTCQCYDCCEDELNIEKLKNTNHELKHLINKLDKLSSSVDTSLTNHTCCKIKTEIHVPECNVCRTVRERNTTQRYEYDVCLCDDCERMLRISRILDEEARLKKDYNIYPLDKYPSGSRHFCDKCEKCVDEMKRRRSRSRSRCCRSRSQSRSSSRLSISRSRRCTPEPRPIWNGGPYKTSYLWRDDYLSSKK